MPIRLIIPVLLTVFVSLGRFFDTPDELRERFREGQTFLATGDFDAAREKYEEVAAARGNWFIDPSRVEVEIEEVRAPVQVAARYQVGNVYRTMGAEELRRATEELPLVPLPPCPPADSLRNAGREHLRLGAVSFREVSGDPHVAPRIRVMAQYLIVECLFEAHAYEDAVDACDTLLSRFPESRYVERTLYTKGWSYWHLGEYDAAIRTFEEQIERFPEGFRGDRARFQIGECYAKLERYGDAVQAFEGLVTRYDFSTYTEKELTQMELQRYREEMGETTRSLVASAYLRLGECRLALGKVEDALDAYRTIPREYASETQAVQRAYLRIAQTLTEKRGYEKGIWGYRDAIEHSEDVVFRGKMHAEVMRLLYENGRYEEAIVEHRLYLRAYGDVASLVGMTEDEVTFRIAECFRELAQFDSAAVEYAAMIEDHPDSYLLPDATFGLAFSYQAAGRIEDALRVYTSLAERFKDHERASAARIQIARILYDRGEYDRAAGTYREMLRLYPESPMAGTAWLELGMLYRKSGQHSDALDALDHIGPDTPEVGRARILMGDILIDLGRFEDARRLLEEEIGRTEDPKVLAELRYELGTVAFGRGEYRGAIGWLTDALSGVLEPDLSESARLTRAVCLYELGKATGDTSKYARAVSDLMGLLEGRPPEEIEGPAQETLGLSMLALGKGEAGVEYFRHSLSGIRSPRRRAMRRLGLAQILYGMDRFDEAIEAGRAVWAEVYEEKDGYGIKARAALVVGDAHVQLTRYEKAIEVLSDAVATYADGPVGDRLVFSLGSAQFNEGTYEDAAGMFASYVKRFPRASDVALAQYYLGHSYQAIGEYERAAETFTELAKKHPDAPYVEEALFLAGENLYDLGHLRGALTAYSEVVDRYPHGTYAPEALYASGWCYLDLEEPERALEMFERAHTRFPDSPRAPDALITLGDYFYNAQEYDAASTQYRMVMERYPDTSQAESAARAVRDLAEITAHRAYERAMGLFDAGQYKDAIRSFEELIEQYPDTYTEMAARCNIGVSYEQLHEWGKAVQIYDRVLERTEGDPGYADARAFASEHKTWVERYRL